MIASTICQIPGCKTVSQYARQTKLFGGFTTEQLCATHAEPYMRCKSKQVGAMGECVWCNADQGELCKAGVE